MVTSRYSTKARSEGAEGIDGHGLVELMRTLEIEYLFPGGKSASASNRILIDMGNLLGESSGSMILKNTACARHNSYEPQGPSG